MNMLYSQRYQLAESFLFFPWAVMFYGTSAASILAIELLVRPQYPTDIADASNMHPRSEIIQDLSVFISCLKSIPAAEGNHASCLRAASTLQKILERVLESPLGTMTNTTASTASTASIASIASAGTTPMTDIDWQVSITDPCDPDYTQWLDSNTWIDPPGPLDIGLEDLGLDIQSHTCLNDLFYEQ